METKHYAALEMWEHLVEYDWIYIEQDATNELSNKQTPSGLTGTTKSCLTGHVTHSKWEEDSNELILNHYCASAMYTCLHTPMKCMCVLAGILNGLFVGNRMLSETLGSTALQFKLHIVETERHLQEALCTFRPMFNVFPTRFQPNY